MGKVLKDGDVIVSENDVNYLIVKTFDYINSTYAVIRKLTLDDKFNLVRGNKDILEEVVIGNDVKLEPIKDPKLKKLLIDNFLN